MPSKRNFLPLRAILLGGAVAIMGLTYAGVVTNYLQTESSAAAEKVVAAVITPPPAPVILPSTQPPALPPPTPRPATSTPTPRPATPTPSPVVSPNQGAASSNGASQATVTRRARARTRAS